MNESKKNLNEKGISSVEVSKRRKTFFSNKEKVISLKRRNRKAWPILVGLILFITVVIILASFIFHKAEIEVVQKTETVSFLGETYLASVKNNLKKGSVVGGKIKVHNRSKKDIVLIANTRFQNNDLIFRVEKPVTILSGSYETVSVKTKSGDNKYLLKKNAKFTIPGFKGDDKFEKIDAVAVEDFKFLDFEITSESTEGVAGKVSYVIVSVNSKKYEKILKADKFEEVKKKAGGKIKITNNMSTTRRLIKNTRFQNGDLVFRIQKSVTIPAKSHVVVSALSDEAGKKYNIKKGTKFNVPGLKNSTSYNYIKGESATDFVGGNIGKENIVDKNVLENAKKELADKVKEELKDNALKKMVSQEYLILSNLRKTNITFNQVSEGENVIVHAQGEDKIPVIPQKSFLTTSLLSDEISLDDLDNIEVNNFIKLKTELTSSNDSINIENGDSFKFKVNGNIEISKRFDQELFKEMVAGKKYDEYLNFIQTSFPKTKMNLKITPFWVGSIPSDIDNINIIIKK